MFRRQLFGGVGVGTYAAAVSQRHPRGGDVYSAGKKFRIVTHHWSDNWNKGFAIYEKLDRLIAAGDLPDVEFWVIGRWPKELKWRAAKTFRPTFGAALAKLLRQCHIYITASLWEPCGMHHIEGAQCGLPVLYHENGGGIVEAAKRYGEVFQDDNVKQVVLDARENYEALRANVLQYLPSGEQMCGEYTRIIQQVADI